MPQNMRLPFCLATLAILVGLLSSSAAGQEKPKFVIEEDCSHFSVAPDNKIVFVVQRQKRMKKIVIQRDDIWVASPNGSKRRIVEGEKFMPAPHARASRDSVRQGDRNRCISLAS